MLHSRIPSRCSHAHSQLPNWCKTRETSRGMYWCTSGLRQLFRKSLKAFDFSVCACVYFIQIILQSCKQQTSWTWPGLYNPLLMLVDLDRLSRLVGQSLSVFVVSAGLLISRAYQFMGDFHMLPLGTYFPSLQPAVFYYLFLCPHIYLQSYSCK